MIHDELLNQRGLDDALSETFSEWLRAHDDKDTQGV
jgi:hypothetical protein